MAFDIELRPDGSGVFDIDLGSAGGGTTGQIKIWNGSTWNAKPVKVWNGSTWVVKPVKIWNGSTWIETSY